MCGCTRSVVVILATSTSSPKLTLGMVLAASTTSPASSGSTAAEADDCWSKTVVFNEVVHSSRGAPHEWQYRASSANMLPQTRQYATSFQASHSAHQPACGSDSSKNARHRTQRGEEEEEEEVEWERGGRGEGEGQEYNCMVSATPGSTPAYCCMGSVVLS